MALHLSGLEVIRGNVIFTAIPERFEVCPGCYIVVRDGRVEGVYSERPEHCRDVSLTDCGDRLIIPGFVDLHLHAPQFLQCGIGLDRELLDWLEQYTFPGENRVADPAYARLLYSRVARDLLYNGTLRCSILGSVHRKSTALLFESLVERGIAAFVGKVNMDRNCPDYLREETANSLQETEALIQTYTSHPLVKPIITPRFAPTSSPGLLKGLGKLAARYNLPVQSHLSETRDEVQWVKNLFPCEANYASVYYRYGLLGQTPTLMAHGIYLEAEEIEMLRDNEVRVVHCPDSNINLSSGIMPARRYLKAGLSLGLGTDIGAGHTLFMPQAMIRTVQLSKLHELQVPEDKALSMSEAFYMGTKGGGAFFGQVGSFEPGYAFDALVVEDDPFFRANLSPLERLQRFVSSGDPSMIVARYVEGKKREAVDFPG